MPVISDRFSVIRLIPPYDFQLSARIFENGDDHFRSFKEGTLLQVLRGPRGPTLCLVSSTGTVERPELHLSTNHDRVDGLGASEMTGRIESLLNLRLDLKPFYRNATKDPTLARLTRELRGLKSPTTESIFEALIDSIVEQQISLRVARTFQRRLIDRYGDSLEVDGSTYRAFPTPMALAKADLGDLRELGLSMRKAEYVRDVSKAAVKGDVDLEGMRSIKEASEVIEELTSIRGVGRWTAELVMIRGMARFDVVPADDLGIRRSLSNLFFKGKPTSADMVRELSNTWGKWKGLAIFYVIMAEHYGAGVDLNSEE